LSFDIVANERYIVLGCVLSLFAIYLEAFLLA